jgi:hypothetical protein
MKGSIAILNPNDIQKEWESKYIQYLGSFKDAVTFADYLDGEGG